MVIIFALHHILAQFFLRLPWLPTYSPQLNSIEILWRFMKYEWIETEAYSRSEKSDKVCRANFKGFWRSLCN